MQDDYTSCATAKRSSVRIVEAGSVPENGTAFRPKPAVRRLTKKVDKLEEKFRALNSSKKLYSFARGFFCK